LQVLLAIASARRRCGKNEVWTECTGCELQCGQDKNTPCTANCRPPSCECSPSRGMRRTADGRCVPVSQCPINFPGTGGSRKCWKRNEKWSECKGCEGTCAQRFVPCTKDCKPAGCECVASEGFVRDGRGNCIKFEDCPRPR
uniref:TIL domain-containing protein n=1 Tax=Ascaris lumbricoides TaxID=6252 RepID=A0A0M3HN12_ASCLU